LRVLVWNNCRMDSSETRPLPAPHDSQGRKTRRVCVSGAGSGMGHQIALTFAGQGCHLVLVGRRLSRLEATAQACRDVGAASVVTAAIDLRDSGCARALATLVKEGPFSAVIAAAGGNAELNSDAPVASGLAWTDWHWTENFRTNVLTAVNLIEGLRDADGLAAHGAVVLFSSIAAFRGSGTGSYGGMKAALHTYAFDLARTLGPQGTTVNVIAPGYVADTEFFGSSMTPERYNALVAQTLTGRAGQPEDIAATVSWLCNPDAGHITGQVIQVNGGSHVGL